LKSAWQEGVTVLNIPNLPRVLLKISECHFLRIWRSCHLREKLKS